MAAISSVKSNAADACMSCGAAAFIAADETNNTAEDYTALAAEAQVPHMQDCFVYCTAVNYLWSVVLEKIRDIHLTWLFKFDQAIIDNSCTSCSETPTDALHGKYKSFQLRHDCTSLIFNFSTQTQIYSEIK